MPKTIETRLVNRHGSRHFVSTGAVTALMAVCAALFLFSACGKDDPVAPEDQIVDYIKEPGLGAQYLDSRELPYAIWIPQNYDPNVEVPLIMALHPGGTLTHYIGGDFINALVGPALGGLGGLVVAPVAKHGDFSSANAETDILALMDSIKANYKIAPGKTLLVGFSMGGAGAWYMAERHPTSFAGVIPIAARPPEDVLDINWGVPLFLIHSRMDDVIPFELAEAAYNDLFAKDVDVNLIAAPNLGHFNVSNYFAVLQAAIPWIQALWG